MNCQLLPCIAPIALAGVEAEWDRLEDFKAVAAALTDPEAQETALQVAYRYMRVQFFGQNVWAEVGLMGERLGLVFADADRLRIITQSPTKPPKETEQKPSVPFQKRRDPNWNSILAGIDFADPKALHDAYDALKTYDPPYRFEDFFNETLARAGPGREPGLIRAVTGWPDFETFELLNLLQALPNPLPPRPALHAAVREAVLEVCRREPSSIYRSGWNARIPFQRLEQEGVLTDRAVVEATVQGFAGQLDSLGAGGLFRMIDALASQLSPAEADEALNYGLGLMEGLLRPEDSDGPWRPALEPPINPLSALAGYIWAGLGSAKAAVRWQYAHTVLGVIELGWTDLLAAILTWAESESPGAFVDQGLEFYLWHARQWLVIGLARAALTAPRAMASAAPLLRSWTKFHHVLIRELAAQALDRLASAGVIDRVEAIDLDTVNRPALPEKCYRGWAEPDVEESELSPTSASEVEKYYFGIDIGPHWFQSLGRAFSMSEGAIERKAQSAVRGVLGWTAGGWRDDARYSRKLFSDSETRHSHGSLPRADDLQAYHSYHAMMFVAADLLETRQVHHREEDEKNSFDDWLDGYRLTRPEGLWLADRRDPRPMVDPPTLSYEQAATWRWEVSRAYLDAQLLNDQGDPVVWGNWHRRQDEQNETVSVRSALVSRTTAESLLVALQTARDPGRFVLPDADRGDDLDHDSFQCAGWIHDSGRDRKLDEYDPWSENLHYPDPKPSEAVVSALSLIEDGDGRAWRDGAGGVLRGETWTHQVGYGREADIENGWRMSANRTFLTHLFQARPDDCLILCVTVRRTGYRHGNDKEDFVEYPWPYSIHYLMGQDGVAQSF